MICNPSRSTGRPAAHAWIPACAALLLASCELDTNQQQTATADPNPDASLVAKAKQWPTWGCEASTFPWSYGSQETCLVIKGEATVTMDDGTVVELKPGTLATFPAGSSCTWDVKQAIEKHYSFD